MTGDICTTGYLCPNDGEVRGASGVSGGLRPEARVHDAERPAPDPGVVSGTGEPVGVNWLVAGLKMKGHTSRCR